MPIFFFPLLTATYVKMKKTVSFKPMAYLLEVLDVLEEGFAALVLMVL